MTAALLLCSMVVSAEDFSVDGIYYNITSETDLTVEVTYQGAGYSAIDEYSGDVTIPAIVKHDGKTFRVTTIGMYAFYGCANLTSVVIPSSVTTINDLAFSSCSGLKSIHIPNSVIEIKQRAFEYCSSLSSLTLPEKLSNVAYELCMGCSKLESIVIPEGVTSIGVKAFNGCQELQTINLPNSLTYIGDYAFYACNSISSPIHIPANVTTIGMYAFCGCSNVTSLTFSEGVTYIGSCAFSGLGITSVVLPNSLTNAEAYMLSGCSNLISVTLSKNLTIIPQGMLEANVKLSSVTIPEGVAQINESAFQNCSSLMAVELPSSITYVGPSSFSVCYGLKSVTVKSDTPPTNGSAFYSGVDKDVCILRVPSESLEAYKAAMYWNEFKNIVAIENTVDLGSCGDKLTWMLTDKDELIIGGTGTMTDYETYEDTPWSRYQNDIAQVTIEAGVVSIGKSAFGGCNNLTSINIPANVTSIGESALAHCSNLKSIVVAEDNLVYDSRNGCNAIIETWTNVLVAGCSTTTIPEDVVSIGNSAFEGCKSLTDVVIPERVADIGMHAFADCNGLTSITCEAVTPPVCGDNAFGNVEKSIPVYVSASPVAAYQAADGWKEFTNIQAMAGDILATFLTLDVTEASLAPSETLTLTATLLPEDATNPTLTWTSSNEKVATVDEYGVVTAVDDGEATITVSTTDGSNLSASCKVTVKSNVLATSLTLDAAEASLAPDETLTLTATLLPEDATNPALAWTSSNEKVATVDEYGVVTAIADGEATITVSTTDGSDLSATCVVTVETKEAEGDVTDYDNMIYFEDATAFVNTTVTLPLQMTNSASITAVQFDVYLPEGVTIEKTSRGKYNVTFNEDRADNTTHTLSSALQDDGAIRVLCYSTESYDFLGGEGAIFYFPLEIPEMEDGDYDVVIRNIVLTDVSGTKYEIPSMTSTMTVLNVAPGDCNADNTIDVADIVVLANHILGTTADGFVEKAADYNADGAVDVADIVNIANYILNGNHAGARALVREVVSTRAAAAGYSLDILPFVLEAEGSKTIALELTDPTASFTAFQCDLYLPEGISIETNNRGKYKFSFNEERTEAAYHTLSGSLQADGAVRMLCYSTDSEVFLGTEGALIYIPLTADASLAEGVYEFSVTGTVLTYQSGVKVTPDTYKGSIVVGDGGEVQEVKLYGRYTSEVLGEYSTVLAANSCITSVDLTEAIYLPEDGLLTTGNPNTIVYLAEGDALSNEVNVVTGDECAGLVLTDGYAFAAPVAFSASQASYGRGLAEGKYGTIVLPYAPDTDDYVFYALTSAGDDVLVFDEVETPAANTPYLYKLRDGKSATRITGNEVAVSSELTPAETAAWQMVGSYANRTIAAGEDGDRYYYAYTSSDNKIHRVTNTLTVKPYRAYFTTASTVGTQLAIRTRGGEETLIDVTEVDGLCPEVYYDLSGRRVDNPVEGVYIVNGKKVVF